MKLRELRLRLTELNLISSVKSEDPLQEVEKGRDEGVDKKRIKIKGG